MAIVFKLTVSPTMVNAVWFWLPNRRRSHRPHLTSAIIPQIYCFLGRVGNWIVGPRRELIFPAVFGEDKSRPPFRNGKAKIGVRNDIDPRGRGITISQVNYIFSAMGGKAAVAVKKL